MRCICVIEDGSRHDTRDGQMSRQKGRWSLRMPKIFAEKKNTIMFITWLSLWSIIRMVVVYCFSTLTLSVLTLGIKFWETAEKCHFFLTTWNSLLVYSKDIGIYCTCDKIYIIYQYLFGIQVCSISAKCLKSREMAKLAYLCSFYQTRTLVNPYLDITTQTQNPMLKPK